MGLIGRFIDDVCEKHPQLMVAVLEQPLAPLNKWLHWDEAAGKVCGCLIGTVALATGASAIPRLYSRNREVDNYYMIPAGMRQVDALSQRIDEDVRCIAARATGWNLLDIALVGQYVANLQDRLCRKAIRRINRRGRSDLELSFYRVGNDGLFRRFTVYEGDAERSYERAGALAVHLMRSRIARSLIIRQSKDSVPAKAARKFLTRIGAK